MTEELHSPKNVTVKYGDILNCTEQYIVHQCNCETQYSAGLAKKIFTRYPYANVYQSRQDETYYDTPGTIIAKGGQVRGTRGVINLFGQRHKHVANDTDDTYEMRLCWFKAGLAAVASIPDISSVAFPEIGCGLAGGNWKDDYFPMILEWAHQHPTISVTVYKYDDDRSKGRKRKQRP